MICKKCGHGYEGNFCNNCGTPADWKNRFKFNKPGMIMTVITWVFVMVFFIFFSPLKDYIIKPKVDVDLPDLPGYYYCDTYSGKANYQISDVDYTITGKDIKFTFTGKKTAELDPDSLTSAVTIQWKLYDDDGKVVAGNKVATSPLKVGESFSITDTDYKFDIKSGEEYKLIIESYKD